MQKNKYIIHNTKYIILGVLFSAAFLERTVFDLGPNYELLTSAMILSAYFFGGKYSFWLTFLVIALTDRIIGNSKIFLFTWSGFLIPALFSIKIIKLLSNQVTKLTKKKFATIISLPTSGVVANIFFYLWTNLGVWILDSWEMYTKDLSGLIRCYINALPFLKNQVISSLVFIPLGYFIIGLALQLLAKSNDSNRLSLREAAATKQSLPKL